MGKSDYNTAKMSLSPFSPQNVMLMPNAAAPKANILVEQVTKSLKTSDVTVNTFFYDFENPGNTPDLDGID